MLLLARLQEEVRALCLEEEPPEAATEPFYRRWIRFWIKVGRGFVLSRCPVRASALAYSSILAFIPLLAVAVGISTSLLKSDAEKIRQWIDDIVLKVAPQLQNSREFGVTLDTLEGAILKMIDNVHSGTLGTTGIIALLVIILFMLARIEETLNDIWGVSKGRSWYARLVNYWAAISLGPVVVAAAIGFSTTLRLQEGQNWLAGLPLIGSLLIGLLPVPVLGSACALFYALMPNTRVRWQAAVAGGLTAGVLWHLNNTLSVVFVTALSRDAAIYGPLAVVPVFMVGLYLFWMLLLFGAQVAYTVQTRRSHPGATDPDRINQQARETMAVRIMLHVARAFRSGSPPPSTSLLADQLRLPRPMVARVTAVLLQGRLLSEVAQGDPGLLPARPIETIALADILTAMRRGTGGMVPADGGAEGAVVEAALRSVAEAERRAAGRTLAELAAGKAE